MDEEGNSVGIEKEKRQKLERGDGIENEKVLEGKETGKGVGTIKVLHGSKSALKNTDAPKSDVQMSAEQPDAPIQQTDMWKKLMHQTLIKLMKVWKTRMRQFLIKQPWKKSLISPFKNRRRGLKSVPVPFSTNGAVQEKTVSSIGVVQEEVVSPIVAITAMPISYMNPTNANVAHVEEETEVKGVGLYGSWTSSITTRGV
ncbi:hypothetical protein Tco_1232753 [Tanacetum coccineum]